MKNDIKKMVREQLILEDKHRYGCVMLYMDVPKKYWDDLIDSIDKDDIHTTDDEGEYGITPHDEFHVTVLFGLHATIDDATIEELIDTLSAPDLKLDTISSFTNDEYDVLKFDIIGAGKAKLSKMNAKFTKLPHTTDFPDYHPHCTIGYLKKGMSKKYNKSLSKDEALSLKPNKIVYSKADRTKKTYKFKK